MSGPFRLRILLFKTTYHLVSHTRYSTNVLILVECETYAISRGRENAFSVLFIMIFFARKRVEMSVLHGLYARILITLLSKCKIQFVEVSKR